MKISESDKIIAEFIGWYPQSTDMYPDAWNNHEGFRVMDHQWFSRSLNALVPVWEKLKPIHGYDVILSQVGDWISDHNCEHENSIQEAAAIATAKAILELKK